MWVRRSNDEIAAIDRRGRRQRLSPLGPFLLAAALTAFVVLVPRSPGSVSAPAMLFTFLVAFVLFYLSRAVLGRYELFGPRLVAPRAIQHRMICPVCGTAQFDTPSHECACGGRLEPLEYWSWTDSENLPPTLT